MRSPRIRKLKDVFIVVGFLFMAKRKITVSQLYYERYANNQPMSSKSDKL
jgi:hypothetical protein